MSGYDKRIDCLPILVGFPALGTLCDVAGYGAAGPSALCSDNLEATLAGWLTGDGCGPGIPISRDRSTVYMCRALLGGQQGCEPHSPVGPEAVSLPSVPVQRSPFPCVECPGNLKTPQSCPHGQLTASVELGCGQIAVPIIGVLDCLR